MAELVFTFFFWLLKSEADCHCHSLIAMPLPTLALRAVQRASQPKPATKRFFEADGLSLEHVCYLEPNVPVNSTNLVHCSF